MIEREQNNSTEEGKQCLYFYLGLPGQTCCRVFCTGNLEFAEFPGCSGSDRHAISCDHEQWAGINCLPAPLLSLQHLSLEQLPPHEMHLMGWELLNGSSYGRKACPQATSLEMRNPENTGFFNKIPSHILGMPAEWICLGLWDKSNKPSFSI